ncbi:MAG TPA: ABC transporter substrate binding protein [Candidatus Binatia bacterium]|jgi:ABC-type uncharacterized transport system substrate-binding protein
MATSKDKTLSSTRHEARDLEGLREQATELAGPNPDVFVAVTTNAAIAVKQAAGPIPLVFMGATDPVTAALVEG